ncbi:MAG: alpha/beta hydrolase [Kiritimatiellae bacterium]|nr:alpha/beta hydrolase [Kiritimatiellia bacterium]
MFAAVLAASVALAADASPDPLRTEDFICWKDIEYGPRRNLPYEKDWHESGQDMDVYMPADGVRGSAPVVMFLHTGAWSQPFDKDNLPRKLLAELLARGAVVCSPGYILQTDNTLEPRPGFRPEATFARMLRDVDEAAGKLKLFLREKGVEPSSFAIAGESAGAHLALLYAYDQGNPAALGLSLKHEFTVTKAGSVAGPVDFPALDNDHDEETSSLNPNSYRYKFRILAKRVISGRDDLSDGDLWPLAAKWSPVNVVDGNSVPTVLAYGQLAPLVTTDGAIPISQMESLHEKLEKAGVPCKSRKFYFSVHYNVADDGAEWIAEALLSP